MNRTNWKICGAAGLATLLLTGIASAQEPTKEQLEAMKTRLTMLQKEIDALKGRVTHQEHRSVPVSADNVAAKGPVKKGPPGPIVVMTSGNRPGICTHDKFNCIYFTSRLHFDAAAYSFDPASALTVPQDPRNGLNARRARIGFIGTFMRDWEYTIVGDFGGSQDGAGVLNNAFVTYKGFGNFWIEGGYMDVPYTLDEQVGSNNILFMERATPQVLAVDIAAGDNRSALGFRTFGKQWWFGSYITGPVAGFDHTARVPVGATARLVFAPVRNDRFTWIVEGDYLRLITTQGANAGIPTSSVRLRDRIEVRVDPGVRLLDTGNLLTVTDADVISAGTALAYNNFYFQGEYFNYRISREVGGDVNFSGGYVQAAYVITGEARRYSESNGAFGGINPKRPFLMGSGGWGAWEVALRYSHANLNDFDAAAVVRGGIQRNLTAGVNWYVSNNVRFMFNYIHGEVERFNAGGINIGAEYDVFATRMQVAF
jgi:phosphate-selective porin OprO and OprP